MPSLKTNYLLTAVLAGSVLSAAADENAAKVMVTTVAKSNAAKTIQLSGKATARQQAQLSPRIDGLVESVAVDAGSKVAKGDVLLQQDEALARLALQRAEQLVAEANTRYLEAKRLHEEAQTLVNTGGIPKTEAEARSTALRIANNALERQKVAASEQAELLERHRLIAPFDGVVSRKLTEVGEWVSRGDPVIELVSTGRAWFDVQAPQELFASLDGKIEATVRLDSEPQNEFPASMASLVPLKDENTRTFLLRLNVDAPDDALVAGTSGSVIISLIRDTKVLVVPRDAVIRRPDGSRAVWVVEDSAEGPVAKVRPVELSDGLGELLEVNAGLKDGERVIVRGNESLNDGQPVEILQSLENVL